MIQYGHVEIACIKQGEGIGYAIFDDMELYIEQGYNITYRTTQRKGEFVLVIYRDGKRND